MPAGTRERRTQERPLQIIHHSPALERRRVVRRATGVQGPAEATPGEEESAAEPPAAATPMGRQGRLAQAALGNRRGSRVKPCPVAMPPFGRHVRLSPDPEKGIRGRAIENYFKRGKTYNALSNTIAIRPR